MDINAMLPFLLGNINQDKKNDDTTGNGIDNMKLIQSLIAGEGLDSSSLLSTLAKNSGNSQIASVMSLAQSMNKNKSNKQAAYGLSPIVPFVNNDIMGRLTKFFTK